MASPSQKKNGFIGLRALSLPIVKLNRDDNGHGPPDRPSSRHGPRQRTNDGGRSAGGPDRQIGTVHTPQAVSLPRSAMALNRGGNQGRNGADCVLLPNNKTVEAAALSADPAEWHLAAAVVIHAVVIPLLLGSTAVAPLVCSCWCRRRAGALLPLGHCSKKLTGCLL